MNILLLLQLNQVELILTLLKKNAFLCEWRILDAIFALYEHVYTDWSCLIQNAVGDLTTDEVVTAVSELST